MCVILVLSYKIIKNILIIVSFPFKNNPPVTYIFSQPAFLFWIRLSYFLYSPLPNTYSAWANAYSTTTNICSPRANKVFIVNSSVFNRKKRNFISTTSGKALNTSKKITQRKRLENHPVFLSFPLGFHLISSGLGRLILLHFFQFHRLFCPQIHRFGQSLLQIGILGIKRCVRSAFGSS